MIGFAALLLFWTISQHQTTVDAGTPITRGAHCTSGLYTENDVQCYPNFYTTVGGVYFCAKYSPEGELDPNPANCGLAADSPVCLYGTENQCTVAVGEYTTYQFRCWEGFENTHQVQRCEKCKTGQYRGRSDGLSRVDVQGESCSLCVPGTYANQEALMACDECQKGQYQPGSCTKDDADGGPDGGCTACKYCPPGQYTDENKQSSCKTCDAGKFYSSSGGQTATVCVVCSGGTFSKSAASTTCDLCPAGYVTPTGGTAADHVTCLACSIGQYSAGDGGTTCTDCEVGKYIDLQHQSACLFCSAGQETNRGENAKGTACVDCTKGTFEDNAQCVDCPSGWNQIQKKQSSCEKCPVGRVAPSTQRSTSCQFCDSGMYVDLAKSTSCKACVWGKFAERDNEPHTSCKECPAGYATNTSASDLCAPCTSRTYQDSRGEAVCKDCPIGQYSEQTAQIACRRCGEGTSAPNDDAELSYSDEEGQMFCKMCPNTEVATATKTGCNTCESEKGLNSFKDGANKCAYCQGCTKGSYKDVCDATATCKSCGVGQFKNTSQTDSNTEVNQGMSWDITCLQCSSCGAGFFRDNDDACRFTVRNKAVFSCGFYCFARHPAPSQISRPNKTNSFTFFFFLFTFTFYFLLVFAGRLRGRCYKMPTMLLQHVQDRCR